MKNIFSNFLIVLSLVFALPAMAAINPNQIQGYQTVFTGKNTVVNGGSEVSQVNGTTLITPTNGSYPIDNVMLTTSVAGVFQSVQVNSTNVATYTTGYLGSLGATNALRWSVLATNGAPAAGAEFASYYPIEGLNFSRFEYGTANAKAGSLQFKVRCSVSGTYSGAIKNYAKTRSYPFSYACTSGTDTQVYVQNISGDTGGTWIGNTNAGAAYIAFDLGSGANFKSTAGTWQTGNYDGVTGSTNLSAQANGASLTITDVQFEVGAFSTQFERKLYDQVLRECQRYLPVINISGNSAFTGQAISTSTAIFSVSFMVPARIPPTGVINSAANLVISNASGGNVNALSAGFSGATVNNVQINATVTAGLIAAGNATVLYTSSGTQTMTFTGAQI